jgi:hypothetical protein
MSREAEDLTKVPLVLNTMLHKCNTLLLLNNFQSINPILSPLHLNNLRTNEDLLLNPTKDLPLTLLLLLELLPALLQLLSPFSLIDSQQTLLDRKNCWPSWIHANLEKRRNKSWVN